MESADSRRPDGERSALILGELQPEPMKVTFDSERCQSNANCLGECPEVFGLDADILPSVFCDQPAEALRVKVEFEATWCPRSTITIVLDDPVLDSPVLDSPVSDRQTDFDAKAAEERTARQ